MTEDCHCPTEAGAPTCDRSSSRRTEAKACPTCNRHGKRIDTLTLKALLALSLTQIRAVEYRFCAARDCSTVYYSADHLQRFAEDVLRERVFQKHADDGDALVCYCFRHTVRAIKDQPRGVGRNRILDSITAAIQAGQCACDIRNPQGSCCLGNVRAVLADRNG